MNNQPIFALVDCNNFFVSCERAFRPDLSNVPAVVLSNNDGCIVARSNEIKSLGVPMGTPYFKAKSILDHHKAQVFSANFALYGNMSWRVTEVLRQFAPEIEVYSVDESFLRIDHQTFHSFEDWGESVYGRVQQWTGIPVSVGIGPSKVLAKAATELAKKSGRHHLSFVGLLDAERLRLLKQLPVGDIWGVGRRNAPKLQNRGIQTAEDLARQDIKAIRRMLGVRGEQLIRELNGESCFPLESHGLQKSMTRTRSFGHRVWARHELESAVANFAANLAAKLRRYGQTTHDVGVFVDAGKHNSEEQRYFNSARRNLPRPTNDTSELIQWSLRVLEDVYDPLYSYKRAGVVLTQLAAASHQQQSMLAPLTTADFDKRFRLHQVLDEVTAKYGNHALRHSAEYNPDHRWQSARKHSSGIDLQRLYALPKVKA